MARVTCVRCGTENEGLTAPPLGGVLGREIVARVCVDCWAAWRDESFRLINHLGLKPADPSDRQRLYVILREYLKLPAVAESPSG